MKPSPLEIISLISGEVTAESLAARHGVTEQEILGWRVAFVAGMKASAAGPNGSRRPRVAWLAALALTLVGTVTFAQLTTFAPNTPALASAINANFTTIKAWLEQKVGSVGTPNITTTGSVSAASVDAGGAITGGSLTTSGNLNVSGDSAIGGSGKTLTVRGTVVAFGASVNLVLDTVYTATSDGFVSALIVSTGTCDTGVAQLYGYAGPGLPVRQQVSVHAGCSVVDYQTAQGSILMPVRKNESYKFSKVGGPATVSGIFIPMGL